MINRDELLGIAKFRGIAPRLAELDYLQDVALISITREFGNALAFKGGTCLYKLYKLNRCSEDLDFTATKGFKRKEFFSRLPYSFGLLGIKGRVKVNEFQNNINAYLQLIGPLYDGRKESAATLIFNISLKERVLLPIKRFPYVSLYQEIRPFDLFAMDEREILAEKVRAIYTRDKARDVYDLWYLLKVKGVPLDGKLVDKKLSVRFEKNKFLAKIDEKKVSWARDLAGLVTGELLPFSQAKEEIKEFL